MNWYTSEMTGRTAAGPAGNRPEPQSGRGRRREADREGCRGCCRNGPTAQTGRDTRRK